MNFRNQTKDHVSSARRGRSAAPEGNHRSLPPRDAVRGEETESEHVLVNGSRKLRHVKAPRDARDYFQFECLLELRRLFRTRQLLNTAQLLCARGDIERRRVVWLLEAQRKTDDGQSDHLPRLMLGSRIYIAVKVYSIFLRGIDDRSFRS